MLVDRDEEQNRCCVIHDDMVLKLLQYLDAHKSMGPDGLQPGVLRELADVVAKALSIILQQSWLNGNTQVDWRLANMMHIFRNGQKMSMVATDLSVLPQGQNRLWKG